MYCSPYPNDLCQSCLELEGEYCGENSICNLPPNMTLYLFFVKGSGKQFRIEKTVGADGCILIENDEVPLGWWSWSNKVQVMASADEGNCSTILFTKDGTTYPCLIYTFVTNPTEMSYTSQVCNSTTKVSGNITGNPDFIQSDSLIGYSELMVIIDGTQVNNIDNNGNTNWTFDNVTGIVQFTYNLQDTPFFILAF